MVVTTTAGHGIFEGGTQTRHRLAGIEQTAVGSVEFLDVAGHLRGDAGEALHKVEGGALAGQQNASRPLQAEQRLIRRQMVAILDQPLDGDLAAQLGKDLVDPSGATENARFTGDDGRVRVEGITTWAMIDRATARLVRIRPEIAAPFLNETGALPL